MPPPNRYIGRRQLDLGQKATVRDRKRGYSRSQIAKSHRISCATINSFFTNSLQGRQLHDRTVGSRRARLCQLTAIHKEKSSAYIGRIFGSEKQRRCRYILRGPESPERYNAIF